MSSKRPLTGRGDIAEHIDADTLICGEGILMREQASSLATPPSGYGIMYVKADGLLYFKNDAGTETLLS
jgi:hypothetical protein